MKPFNKSSAFLATRVICSALVITFLGSDLAQAASLSGIGNASLPATGVKSQLLADARLLEVPTQFCQYKEAYQAPAVNGNPAPLILMLQDAHANLSGQQNLAKTLEALMKQYDFQDVFVEGGEGDVSLGVLRELSDAKTMKRVAGSFLREAEIAGEEYLNLTSSIPMKLTGVEDINLYAKGLKAYAALAKKREDILTYLGKSRTALDKLKKRNYPYDLQAYEKKSSEAPSVEGLIELARNYGVDFSSYIELTQLANLLDREKKIDFNLARLELASIYQKIGNKDSGDLAQQLAAQPKEKNAAQSMVIQKVKKAALDHGISLAEFPNFVKYAEYLEAFTAVSMEKTLDETAKLEETIYTRLLDNPTSQTLRAIDRYVKLLETAYRIQMTSDEFALFLENTPDFPTISWQAFLNRAMVEEGIADSLIPLEKSLEDGRVALEAFYRAVDERDLAFVKNIDQLMQHGSRIEDRGSKIADKKTSLIAIQNPQSSIRLAALITGGYHTQHLSKLLKEKGYSYVVLSPIVTQATDQAKYEKVLLSPLGETTKIVQTVNGRASVAGVDGSRAVPLAYSRKRVNGIESYAGLLLRQGLTKFNDGVSTNNRRLEVALQAARLADEGPEKVTESTTFKSGDTIMVWTRDNGNWYENGTVERVTRNQDGIDLVHIKLESGETRVQVRENMNNRGDTKNPSKGAGGRLADLRDKTTTQQSLPAQASAARMAKKKVSGIDRDFFEPLLEQFRQALSKSPEALDILLLGVEEKKTAHQLRKNKIEITASNVKHFDSHKSIFGGPEITFLVEPLSSGGIKLSYSSKAKYPVFVYSNTVYRNFETLLTVEFGSTTRLSMSILESEQLPSVIGDESTRITSRSITRKYTHRGGNPLSDVSFVDGQVVATVDEDFLSNARVLEILRILNTYYRNYKLPLKIGSGEKVDGLNKIPWKNGRTRILKNKYNFGMSNEQFLDGARLAGQSEMLMITEDTSIGIGDILNVPKPRFIDPRNSVGRVVEIQMRDGVVVLIALQMSSDITRWHYRENLNFGAYVLQRAIEGNGETKTTKISDLAKGGFYLFGSTLVTVLDSTAHDMRDGVSVPGAKESLPRIGFYNLGGLKTWSFETLSFDRALDISNGPHPLIITLKAGDSGKAYLEVESAKDTPVQNFSLEDLGLLDGESIQLSLSRSYPFAASMGEPIGGIRAIKLVARGGEYYFSYLRSEKWIKVRVSEVHSIVRVTGERAGVSEKAGARLAETPNFMDLVALLSSTDTVDGELLADKAAEVLAKIQLDEVINKEEVIELRRITSGSSSVYARKLAIDALKRVSRISDETLELFIHLMNDNDRDIREQVTNIFLDDKREVVVSNRAAEHLLFLIPPAGPELRSRVLLALSKVKGASEPVMIELIKLIKDETKHDPELMRQITSVLSIYGTEAQKVVPVILNKYDEYFKNGGDDKDLLVFRNFSKIGGAVANEFLVSRIGAMQGKDENGWLGVLESLSKNKSLDVSVKKAIVERLVREPKELNRYTNQLRKIQILGSIGPDAVDAIGALENIITYKAESYSFTSEQREAVVALQSIGVAANTALRSAFRSNAGQTMPRLIRLAINATNKVMIADKESARALAISTVITAIKKGQYAEGVGGYQDLWRFREYELAQEEVLRALKIDSDGVVPGLISFIKSEPEWDLIGYALDIIGGIGADANLAIPSLLEMLRDDSPFVQGYSLRVAEALGRIGAEAASEAFYKIILKRLMDPDGKYKRNSVEQINQMGVSAAVAVPYLQEALREDFVSGLSAAWKLRLMGSAKQDLSRSPWVDTSGGEGRVQFERRVTSAIQSVVGVISIAARLATSSGVSLPPILSGRVFDESFVREQLSLKQRGVRTVAIDLDETLAYSDAAGKYTLREGIVDELKKLRDRGIRLVLWTGSSKSLFENLGEDERYCQMLWSEFLALRILPASF